MYVNPSVDLEAERAKLVSRHRMTTNDEEFDTISYNDVMQVQTQPFDKCYYDELADDGYIATRLVHDREFIKNDGTTGYSHNLNRRRIVWFKVAKRYHRDDRPIPEIRMDGLVYNRYTTGKSEDDVDIDHREYSRSRFLLFIDGQIRNDDYGFSVVDGYVYFRFRQELHFTDAMLVEFMNPNFTVLRNVAMTGDLANEPHTRLITKPQFIALDNNGFLPVKVNGTKWDLSGGTYGSNGEVNMIVCDTDGDIRFQEFTKRVKLAKDERLYSRKIFYFSNGKYKFKNAPFLHPRILDVRGWALITKTHYHLPYTLVDEDIDISKIPQLPMTDTYKSGLQTNDLRIAEMIKANNDYNEELLNEYYKYNRYSIKLDDVSKILIKDSDVIDYQQEINKVYRLRHINRIGDDHSFVIDEREGTYPSSMDILHINIVDRVITFDYILDSADGQSLTCKVSLVDEKGNLSSNELDLSGTHGSGKLTATKDGVFRIRSVIVSNGKTDTLESKIMRVYQRVKPSVHISNKKDIRDLLIVDFEITDVDNTMEGGVVEISDSSGHVIHDTPITRYAIFTETPVPAKGTYNIKITLHNLVGSDVILTDSYTIK